MTIEDLLIQDEGMKLKAYLDTKGKITIGVGRNLEEVGISEAEALAMLANDVAAIKKEASNYIWFQTLDEVRQMVVLSMIFNMGAGGFNQFQRLQAAIAKKDFDAAANEMLASRWASQVGKRAVRLSFMMRTGQCSAQ